MNDALDRLMDALLREELGRERPPDLTDRILAAAARQRRRMWAVALLPMAAAAGVVIAVALLLLLREGAYPAPRAIGDFQLLDSARLARGATLRTGAGAARLALGRYCTVDIQPESEVRLGGGEFDEEIALQRGAVVCDVEAKKGRFTVQTEVGLVRVKGTQFEVRLHEDGRAVPLGKQMTVRVLTGEVAATGAWGNITLAAGETQTLPPPAVAAARASVEPTGEAAIPGIHQPEAGAEKPVAPTAAPKAESPNAPPLASRPEPKPRPSPAGAAAPKVEVKSDLARTSAPVASTPKASGAVLKLNGILVSRTQDGTSVMVKADGEKEARKYVAQRQGGASGASEGYDKDLVEAIRKLHSGNRVELAWIADDPRRVLGIRAVVPEQKRGVATGALLAKEGSWFDLKPDGGHPPQERYVVRWVGGRDGRIDPEVAAVLAKAKIGDRLRVEWTYEERKRANKVEALGAGAPAGPRR